MSQSLSETESGINQPNLDPTTEVEIPFVHDQREVLSLIEQYEQSLHREDLLTPDSTHAEGLLPVQAIPIAASSSAALADFIVSENEQPGFLYQPLAEKSLDSNYRGDNCFEHYAEIMAMVRSYEKMIDDDFDLGVILRNYPELQRVRLMSLSVYRSGTVILLGLDQQNMPVNVFDRIDRISFAISPVKRTNTRKPRGEVAFFFHDRAD